jgi:hypothetical protein
VKPPPKLPKRETANAQKPAGTTNFTLAVILIELRLVLAEEQSIFGVN